MAQSQADILAKLDALQAATDAERAEVLAALKALKDMIAAGGDLTAIGGSAVMEIDTTVGAVPPK